MDKHRSNRRYLWIWAMLCFFVLSKHCLAAEADSKVIRVVLPQLEGEVIRDEFGNLSGYTYEYLEKISQYTGWSYEYITFEGMETNESIVKAMDMVAKGEADILGSVLKTPNLEEMYEFSEKNYGIVNTILTVLEDNTKISETNYMLCDPLRIAVLENAKVRNKEMKEYLDTFQVKYELIPCKTRDDQYESLLENKADAMLDVSLSSMPRTKQIAQFMPRPYFFIATKGQVELVQQIDEVIEKINYSFPQFEKQLFDKYYGDTVGEFVIKDEEKEFIQRKKELNVLCFTEAAPFVFLNSKKEVSGIAVSIMDKFGEMTGLKIKYHVYNKKSGLETTLNGLEYDCILGIPLNSSYKSKYGLISTNSYMQVPTVIFTNKNAMNKPQEEMRVALREKSDLTDMVVGKEKQYYNSLQECINAVASGKADCGYGNSRLVEFYTEEEYTDLFVVPMIGREQNMEFTIPNNSEKQLLSLLNRYIHNINENDLYTYTLEANSHIQKNELKSYVRANPLKTVLILTIFLFSFFAAIVLIFVVQSGRKKNSELKIANAAKTDFFSRVSHDMRTPMNAVVGFSEMSLTEKPDKETLISYMHKINVSGKYLLRLIDDILDMAQIENKKMLLHVEPTDLKALVENVMAIMQPQMNDKNIHFTVEMEGFEENERYVADKMHLQQILINLLNNAAKFTENHGNISWKMEIRKETDQNAQCKITIKDDGMGIEKELLERLFVPFAQGDNSYIQKGIGLGLPIVKSLVDLMNGKIEIKSEIDKGTEIVVKFSTEIAKAEEKPSKENRSQKAEDEILRGKKILLCEDHPINTQLAIKLLEKKEMKVYHAENGKIAIDLFEKSDINFYDAILMDLRMPVLDGIEATRQIRQLRRGDAKSIPIIALTANTLEEDLKKCQEVGMNEHLAKPINPKVLYQILANTFCTKHH